MNININADWQVFRRIATALESFAADYKVVNAAALGAAELSKAVDEKVGKSYYQSDAAVYAAEQEAKLKERIKRGEFDE